jgi:glycosyltransferase involved in cell wall biosynthesis
MKNVLIVSYHFPPDGAIGAVRAAELAKRLPELGWKVVVLSVQARYYDQVDAVRYRGLSVDVERTVKMGSVNALYLYVKSWMVRLRRQAKVSAKEKEWFLSKRKSEGIRERVLRYYNSLLIYLPDKELGWMPFAVWKGVWLIRQRGIDAFVTTSPPHSVQLIGLLLKWLTGRVWIVDFRDPWEVELKPNRSRSRASDWIERCMERAVISSCDWVVCVTDTMTRRLEEIYPNLKGKFIFIPNGYDSEALASYQCERKYPVFTITYVGSLYFGRSPLVFLEAIAELIGEKKIGSDAIRVRFVGNCRASDGKSVEEMVCSLGLKDNVEFVGSVPHDESLREIARSQVLLLMASSQPLQIPGKVYEYIGLRASILAVCQDGATKNLLRLYPRARLVSPDNLSETKAAILSLYRESEGNCEADRFPYEKYERTAIAKQVADLLVMGDWRVRKMESRPGGSDRAGIVEREVRG